MRSIINGSYLYFDAPKELTSLSSLHKLKQNVNNIYNEPPKLCDIYNIFRVRPYKKAEMKSFNSSMLSDKCSDKDQSLSPYLEWPFLSCFLNWRWQILFASNIRN